MISTIVRVQWTTLKRDRGALVLSFVLPLVFFTIFAGIFGAAGGGAGPGAIDVAVVDLDGTEASGRLAAALAGQDALKVRLAPDPTPEDPAPAPYSLAAGRRLVRDGKVAVAVVLPAGFGATFGDFSGGEPVEVVYDAADPVARHTVSGLLQAAAMTAAPDLMMKQGLGLLETHGGPLTAEQRRVAEQAQSLLRGDSGAGGGVAPAGLVQVAAVDVRTYDEAGEDEPERSIVAYYAAGIGVMFLLFSMAGAGGALLEEEESGVLERLLISNVSMPKLLLGKWLFFTALGLAQVSLMFLWGALVFGLDLFTAQRLVGCGAMALVTAAAAAAFGIVLATICRSRSQLSALSTIVILIMSALGGSMMPRFVMPDFMDTVALFTLNGWALDGFLEVFWYDDPAAGVASSLAGLAPQLAVLVTLAAALLFLARLFARRWETL